ncbi:MAG: NAD(+)/NADH kinase [Dehalococcoidia bacterium]
MKRVSVCYHPSVPGAEAMTGRLRAVAEAAGAETLVSQLSRDGSDEDLGADLVGADVLVCVGGDGTVLHATGIASSAGVPVFGVRMGRLGFLAEATAGEAEDALTRIIGGEGRLERRVMLQAQVGEAAPQHALNDVVIGRMHLGRTVTVGLRVDGVLLAEYRADAVMAATATGSTGYSLSVGGPILHPTSDDLIVTAVAPHLSYPNALVLPGDASIEFEVARGYEAVLLVDGGHEQAVTSGTFVRVTRSPREALFLRLGAERQFYANLARRLGWLRIDHVVGNDDPAEAGFS